MVVRVLSSTETIPVGTTALDKLGATIAKYTNSKYHRNSLSKTREARKLKFLGKNDRIEELNNLYNFVSPQEITTKYPNILIIDDITTTGSTIKEINRTIKSVLPGCNVYFFCIGKTSDHTTTNQNINKRILEEFNKTPKQIFHSNPFSILDTKNTVNKNKMRNPLDEADRIMESFDQADRIMEGFDEADRIMEGFDEADRTIDKEVIKPPGPNLSTTKDGKWVPDTGYEWTNPNDKSDLSVKEKSSDFELIDEPNDDNTADFELIEDTNQATSVFELKPTELEALYEKNKGNPLYEKRKKKLFKQKIKNVYQTAALLVIVIVLSISVDMMNRSIWGFIGFIFCLVLIRFTWFPKKKRK